jgi:hypothetical protein
LCDGGPCRIGPTCLVGSLRSAERGQTQPVQPDISGP